jgi:hypothetical protein
MESLVLPDILWQGGVLGTEGGFWLDPACQGALPNTQRFYFTQK